MQIIPIKKLYLPALSIIAVVFILIVLIVISTHRNLEREKTIALHFFYRHGLAMIHSIEASVRTGMKSLMWQEISLGSLMHETAKDDCLAYVYLIDGNGIIIHHSDPSYDRANAGWKPVITSENQVVTRTRTFPDGRQIYELSKIFSPMFEPSMTNHNHQIKLIEGSTSPHSHSGNTIVLGMKMTEIEEARRADIQHAAIMATIILILGSGAFFFIFIIQNYYLVDKTLKQTKHYTQQVIANMANGLISIDREGKIASYNFLALKLLGLDESEAKDKDLKDIIDFKTSGIQDTLENCSSVMDYEIHYQKETGETVPLALSATPIQEKDDNCEGAVIELRDLSGIKLLEEKVRQSERLAVFGELAAGVAHEIRNPLSSIRGFAQFLRQSLKDKPQEKEYAETMVSEVDRINRVLTDLLTFARPMKAKLVPTDVNKLIAHSVRLIEEDALSRNVEIQTRISDLSMISLDVNQITQALLNLLINALQAVSEGGHIEIGAELNADESYLHFWVEDNGFGIPSDKKEKIFDPFFTNREKGTGLGLSIVHKIVENHNGEIRLNSPPNGKAQGCRFTILIPIDITASQTYCSLMEE